VHHSRTPAAAVVELRLADVLAGMPIFSPLSRSGCCAVDGIGHGAHLALEAAQETLRLTALLFLLSSLRSMIRTVMRTLRQGWAAARPPGVTTTCARAVPLAQQAHLLSV
jgi:hypothetical protein